jgi:hypothetical protein
MKRYISFSLLRKCQWLRLSSVCGSEIGRVAAILTAILFVLASGAAEAVGSRPLEPQAGLWQTYVLTSGSEIPVPPPAEKWQRRNAGRVGRTEEHASAVDALCRDVGATDIRYPGDYRVLGCQARL